MNAITKAFAGGYECLSAWADLLDRINVFPVADGDTGANLRVSLAPLRDSETDRAMTVTLLARCALGNSGNIAAAFFQEFCQAEEMTDLAQKAEQGRRKAWQVLATPRAGTMLDVFDRLAAALISPHNHPLYPFLCRELQDAVAATAQLLPDLKKAGVVDAGALAMYIFLEGFFRNLLGEPSAAPPLLQLFAGRLSVNPTFHGHQSDLFCVNATLCTQDNQRDNLQHFAGMGESVVILPAESGFRIHVHTVDPQQLKAKMARLGTIADWSDESINTSLPDFSATSRQVIHIMTDAAGSLTREMARRLGITLLDSYIIAEGQGRPESLCSPQSIYALMQRGGKVSTAQASIFERHQHYRNVCQQYGRTLYLSVGSRFTGNYDIAEQWKKTNDPRNLLEIIDSGAASGRLALLALLAARYAERAATTDEVIGFAKKCLYNCQELVFIDNLKYLAAGGRISRSKGFFAGLFNMKPIISPTREGVRKMGVVHSRSEQISFALKRLRSLRNSKATILLQYTDNADWVMETVLPQVRNLAPGSEILTLPLSLTSGVHMGPGAWALAWEGEGS